MCIILKYYIVSIIDKGCELLLAIYLSIMNTVGGERMSRRWLDLCSVIGFVDVGVSFLINFLVRDAAKIDFGKKK